jgi:hypothetical protein
MPEHFTKLTVSASFWCAKCGKATMHRVDDRRRGPCMVCMEAVPHGERKPRQIEQASLFSDALVRDKRGD